MHRILVAEDEERLRAFLVEALEPLAHDVIGVPDGLAAMAELDRNDFDLLITDIRMPGLDGLEVLRRTRFRHPDTEVIVLTAFGTVEGAVEAMKLGAFDYLEKPLENPAVLRNLVSSALRRGELRASGRKPESAGDEDEVRLSFASESMKTVEHALRRAAATDSTILLLGESGVGKEVAARAVHRWSHRRDGPFVAVNCAGLLDGLLESTLFGHEKGAFTGAHERRRGRVELAQGGTFFLDEIGEMKGDVQARLLRVLEERSFSPVGSEDTVAVDVRWIAATNADLETEVANNRFRADLFHRISVFPVRIPPLRDRREDILPIAEVLLARTRRSLGRPELRLAEDAEDCLFEYDFPGNIRELANILERAAILATGDVITAREIEYKRERRVAPPRLMSEGPVSMEEAERRAIAKALRASGGNRKVAASTLGIGLRTLYDKLKKYGLP